MNYLQSEDRRQRDYRKPDWVKWHLVWGLQDARNEALAWLMHDVRIPALLCTEIEDVLKYADKVPVEIVMNPVEAILQPIEGYSWLDCLACLERWALDFNEVER